MKRVARGGFHEGESGIVVCECIFLMIVQVATMDGLVVLVGRVLR